MDKTRVMNEIIKNPFVFIHPDTRTGKFNLNWSGIHLSAFDDAISAMEARDLFVKEWYGDGVYYHLIKQYKNESDKLVKFANTYFDGGDFYDKDLKKITDVFRFSYGDKNCYFFANKEIAKNMFYGKISLKSGEKVLYFKDGLFHVKKHPHDFGVEVVDQLKKPFQKKGDFRLTKVCQKTGKIQSYFRYQGKTYEKGRFDNHEDAQKNSFNMFFEITGMYHKFDKRHSGKINDIDISVGIREKKSFYQSSITICEKDYFIGSFYKKSDAVYSFFDAHYLFKGFLHKEDKRSLNDNSN